MINAKKYLAGIAVAASLIGTTAIAQTVETSDQGIRFLLGNDRYEAGNVIIVSEAMDGDLFAAGSQIVIQETVRGDVHMAGSAVSVLAEVGDDVRAAGANVLIQNAIRGDAMLAGATVQIAEGATIDGSAALAGESILINGDILGNVKIDGEKVTINGTISGTAEIRAEKVTINGVITGNSTIQAKEIAFGETGTVQNDLRYWTLSNQETVGNAVQGTATFDEKLKKQMPSKKGKEQIAAGVAAFMAGVSVWFLVSMFVLLVVFQLMTKTFFVDAAKTLRKSAGISLLWGLLYFLLIPAVILVCMLTIIGIPLGIILLCMYIATLIVASPMAALTLARVWEQQKKRKKGWSNTKIIFAALLILVLLEILWIVPVIGWIAKLLIIGAGYGAVLQAKSVRYKKVA